MHIHTRRAFLCIHTVCYIYCQGTFHVLNTTWIVHSIVRVYSMTWSICQSSNRLITFLVRKMGICETIGGPSPYVCSIAGLADISICMYVREFGKLTLEQIVSKLKGFENNAYVCNLISIHRHNTVLVISCRWVYETSFVLLLSRVGKPQLVITSI